MSKAKKGLLLAGTIMTTVGNLLAIVVAILLIWLGSKFTEGALVEIFRSAPETYEYYTNYLYQGVRYEYVIIDVTVNEIMLPETIAMAAEMLQMVFKVLGFIIAAFAGIKLLLAIIALAVSGKKFAKGAVITLVVFSFLTFAWLEAGLLIGALCVKNKKQNIEEPNQNQQMPEMMA